MDKIKKNIKKILFIAYKHEYGRPDFGLSYEYYNFYDILAKMNNGQMEVVYFPVDEITQKYGYLQMNQKLLEAVEKEKPDLCFFVILKWHLEKETVKKISQKKDVITFCWFTDDHWAFDNFSKHWANCFDWVATTDADSILKYKKIGYKNAIKTQWGYDHFIFKPLDLSKIYDVSFVGEPHGNRKKVVAKLEKAGIKIECFGKGWHNGRASREKMVQIISQSKINLNFAKSSGKINFKHIAKIFFKKRIDNKISIDSPKNWLDNAKSLLNRRKNQIKIRNFEIPGCQGFLLTDYVKDLESYYKIGQEIVCYKNTEDLIEKIKYYLHHENERAQIAKLGYERTIKDHTYEKRFNEIFKKIVLANG